jgi:hypothetical protein
VQIIKKKNSLCKFVQIKIKSANNTHHNLLRRPSIKIHGFDFGNVDAKIPMYSGTADAKEEAEVPGCPAGAY